MDSFEPIRAAAEHLHHQVADGATPKKPMELVNAAIKHLKLGLTWLPTGDPALKGARAVFDDQSGTIFAEDVGERIATRARCCARNRTRMHPRGFGRLQRGGRGSVALNGSRAGRSAAR